jgi:dTDP-4-amino-4,6-dideoxygalactose transaminase
LDLTAQFAAIEDEIRDAMDRVLASQYFIMGPEVEAFEREVAQYIGSTHGIGVASGSDALLLCFMALEIGEGDAVVTTPYSFFATAGSISRLGAFPLFVDIEPETGNIDPQRLRELFQTISEEKNSHRTKEGRTIKAIVPVHLFGQMAEMEPIAFLADGLKIPIIEDAAQAIGSTYREAGAGSLGIFGCFSFFPSKNLGGFGDGGMVTTGDEDLAERIRILRNHGSKPKYYHHMVGVNSRLDALQAAVLRVKLKYLDRWSKKRRENADRYRVLFRDTKISAPDGPIILPTEAAHRYHIYNQFVIRTPRRDDLRTFLAEQGIGTEVYYPIPLHLQKCYAYLGYREGDFPVSEEMARTSLALPIYPELTGEMMGYVVEKIAQFFGGGA